METLNRVTHRDRLNILVIGSGGREHAIIKALKKSTHNPHVYCYGSHNNAGILSSVEAFGTGDLCNFDGIIAFSKMFKIDFAIIGPESPLVQGIVNVLTDQGIRCIGPSKEYAILEGSKSFTRSLLDECEMSEYNPKWKNWAPRPLSRETSPDRPTSYTRLTMTLGFSEMKQNKFEHVEQSIRAFINSLGNKSIVVKADGLKGGKGVKVQGDHFETIEEGIVICKNLYNSREGFVIEEKLIGEEFSLISFTDGITLKHAPPVRDYKRVYNDDKGPNCGGMGSVTNLNFSTPEDIDIAQTVNENVMKSLVKRTISDKPLQYTGFLYGSFIKLLDGTIKVIEYNTRLGDPESINVLGLLKTDFVDICLSMLNKTLGDISFNNEPSKCVYMVPKGYPGDTKSSTIDIRFTDLFTTHNLEFYIAGLVSPSKPKKEDLVPNTEFSNTTTSNIHAGGVSVDSQKFTTHSNIAIGSSTTRNYDYSPGVIYASGINPESAESSESVVIDMDNLDDDPLLIDDVNEFTLNTINSRSLAILAIGTESIIVLDKVLHILKSDPSLKDLYFRTDIGKGVMTTPISYKDSGVNIDEANKAVSNIQKFARSTYNECVIDNPGGFGGMMKFYQSPTVLSKQILVSSTDSVGSKSEFVKAYSSKTKSKKYEDLGNDIVNHCVNDILVQSLHTQPLFFLDYFATHALDREVFEPFVKGVSEACIRSGCVLIGGETAEIPALYREGAVDLVGAITGVIQDESLVLKPRETIRPGDVVYALSSVSPHTNGYTLLKRLVDNAVYQGDDSYLPFIEDWCRPHKCYLDDIRHIRDSLNDTNVIIRGLCHITGGGLIENPPRILPINCDIEWDEVVLESMVPGWMKWMQQRVAPEEFRRVFNCGVGMLIIVSCQDESLPIKLNSLGMTKVGYVKNK